MNHAHTLLFILCLLFGMAALIAIFVYVFVVFHSTPMGIPEQKDERSIFNYVLVNGLTVEDTKIFQGIAPYTSSNREYSMVTKKLGLYLRLHPNDVLYVGSPSRRRMLLGPQFNFSYRLDIERASEQRLVSVMGSDPYKVYVKKIFEMLSKKTNLDIVVGPINVLDWEPEPTKKVEKIVTQDVLINGLTPQEVEANREAIIAILAKNLNVNPADIKITRISSTRRRLLTGTVVSYTISSRSSDYENLIDTVESKPYQNEVIEDIAELTKKDVSELSIESRKVVAEDYVEPLVCTTDCNLLTSTCLQGTCEDGECVTIPRNEGQECNDENVCTINTVCTDGICKGDPKTCYDNNPCTIDKCIEDVGCMEQQQSIVGACIPGCESDSTCPTSFVCHDGTCLNIDYDGMLFVRFINYEIQNCEVLEGVGHRLLVSFIMDAEKHTVGVDEMFRVASKKEDITASNQDLGFIDEVIDINIIQVGDVARSAFTLSTACQTITVENCETIFANREFQFDINVKDCNNINSFPAEGCIDPNSHVSAHIDLSLSDCTVFPTETQNIKIYQSASVFYQGVRYEGVANNRIVLSNSSKIVVAMHRVANQVNLTRNILTNVRACVPDFNHRLGPCVDNSTKCSNHGCYNWQVFDSPLESKYDFLDKGYITALAMSTFNIKTCYEQPIYHETDAKICEEQKCEEYEDGFEISTLHLPKNVPIIFDLIYREIDCTNFYTNEKEQFHDIVKIELI